MIVTYFKSHRQTLNRAGMHACWHVCLNALIASAYLPGCLPACMPACLPACLSFCASAFLLPSQLHGKKSCRFSRPQP
jgi:hypothetical protein